MSRFSTKRYDRNCWHILNQSGTVVALSLALTNGRWRLCDCNEKSLASESYASPKDALKAFTDLQKDTAAINAPFTQSPIRR
jgi:hypothetical protein